MKKASQSVNAQEQTPAWIYVLVTILCIGFLAVGFFFAARQHFVAMDLGIKNSKLRKQLEDLEGENRRLVLNREVVRSPLEMKRIATRRGLRPADDLFVPVNASLKQQDNSKLVQKTAMSDPADKRRKPIKAFYAPGTKVSLASARPVAKTLIASSKIR